MSELSPLWHPDDTSHSAPRIAEFKTRAETVSGQSFLDYNDLHRWSIEEPEAFWKLAWDFCGIIGRSGDRVFVPSQDLKACDFFPDARLNIVETFLKNADERDAIIFVSEDGQRLVWSRAHLKSEVGRIASALRAEGIVAGDRVAGYVPNMSQTVAVMLATASLGAVWSSCAPENGPDVVVDRFGQIKPKIMFAADGYFYNGKVFDTLQDIAAVANRVTSIEKVIVWPHANKATNLQDIPNSVSYEVFSKNHPDTLTCVDTRFRDPLYIMFSSGTTGKPKCIEHSGGGTLLRTMVEHQLQSDLKPNDRILYYTTCSWMMWNWLVAGLASEATIILYDGNPMYPEKTRLFDIVDAEKLTHFGISAKYIDALAKAKACPADTHELNALRIVLSTGSPLLANGFEHVYRDWKKDVQLISFSGGTDILGSFVGGAPILPVYSGEIQAPILGLDVAVFDDQANPLIGSAGELVCRNAHPSMPIRFLHDPSDERYNNTYFTTYPGIWHQGDFAIETENGSYIILGRSDATLNPGGVRIGTAEIYSQVDKIEEVLDCVVVGQEYENDTRVIMFVVLANSVPLDDTLILKIRQRILKNASPRHVPAKIIAVPDIPRTKSGKIVELAVRDIVNNKPVRNLSGLANPEVLDLFTNIPELIPA